MSYRKHAVHHRVTSVRVAIVNRNPLASRVRDDRAAQAGGQRYVVAGHRERLPLSGHRTHHPELENLEMDCMFIDMGRQGHASAAAGGPTGVRP
jgi:hypothetical protein